MDTYDMITLKAEQPSVTAPHYGATRRELWETSPPIPPPVSVKWERRLAASRVIPLGLHTSSHVPVQVSSEGPGTRDELPLSSPS